MTPTTSNYPTTISNLKTPLAIIRSHTEHLLAAQGSLSAPQALTLLKAIQLQTILLEYLLNELTELPQSSQEDRP